MVYDINCKRRYDLEVTFDSAFGSIESPILQSFIIQNVTDDDLYLWDLIEDYDLDHGTDYLDKVNWDNVISVNEINTSFN